MSWVKTKYSPVNPCERIFITTIDADIPLDTFHFYNPLILPMSLPQVTAAYHHSDSDKQKYYKSDDYSSYNEC